MPLTKKGRKIKANMEAEYGKNKGTIKGVAKGKHHGKGKRGKK